MAAPAKTKPSKPSRRLAVVDVCRGCGQSTADGSDDNIAVLRAVWHRECFKCSECGEALTLGSFTNIDDEPFCRQHYIEKSSAMPAAEVAARPTRMVQVRGRGRVSDAARHGPPSGSGSRSNSASSIMRRPKARPKKPRRPPTKPAKPARAYIPPEAQGEGVANGRQGGSGNATDREPPAPQNSLAGGASPEEEGEGDSADAHVENAEQAASDAFSPAATAASAHADDDDYDEGYDEDDSYADGGVPSEDADGGVPSEDAATTTTNTNTSMEDASPASETGLRDLADADDASAASDSDSEPDDDGGGGPGEDGEDEAEAYEKMLARRKHVTRELLETEISYTRHIGYVVELLIHPLRELAATKKAVCSNDDIVDMFSNMEVLHFCHQQLSDALSERMETTLDDCVIGDVLLDKTKFLRVYTNYVSNYNNALATVKRLKRQPAFRRFVEAFEDDNKDKFRKLELKSFLIMPIQRIPRYLLLLKEVIKYTPHMHPDYANLNEALESITELADFVDNSKVDSDHLSRIRQIQNSMSGDYDRLTYDRSRQFVRQGVLTKAPTSGIGLRKTRMCFLFNDLFVYAAIKGEDTFAFKGQIRLESATVEVDDAVENSFTLTNKTGTAYFMTAADKDECDTWVHEIQNSIALSRRSTTGGDGLMQEIEEEDIVDPRQRLLIQLVGDERRYVAALTNFKETFLDAMIARARTDEPLMSLHDIPKISPLIGLIKSHHEDFAGEIEALVRAWGDDGGARMAAIFKARLGKPFRKLYLTYAKRVPQATATFAAHAETDKGFRNFLELFESRSSPLEVIIGMPQNRIPVYDGLVRGLLAKTPADEDGREMLVKVKASAPLLLGDIERAYAAAEANETLIEIMSRMTDWPPTQSIFNLEMYREGLVKMRPVEELNAGSSSATMRFLNRQLLLLNLGLVYVDVGPNNSYIYKGRVDCSAATVASSAGDDTAFEMEAGGFLFFFKCNDVEERDAWVRSIRGLMERIADDRAVTTLDTSGVRPDGGHGLITAGDEGGGGSSEAAGGGSGAAEAEGGNSAERARVVTAFVDIEQHIVDRMLEPVSEWFLQQIRSGRLLNASPFITGADMAALSDGTLEDVIVDCQSVVADLRALSEGAAAPSGARDVGEVFVNRVQTLGPLYAAYLSSVEHRLFVLQQLEQNDVFSRILADFHLKHRVEVEGSFALAARGVERYCSFIDNLSAQVPAASPEHASLSSALGQLKVIAQRLNSKILEIDERVALRGCQHLMKGKFDDLARPGRWLLRRGEVERSTNPKGKRKTALLLLLNDGLVYALRRKPSSKHPEPYEFKSFQELKTLTVATISEEEAGASAEGFGFILTARKFKVCAFVPTVEERDAWARDIGDSIETSQSLRARTMSLKRARRPVRSRRAGSSFSSSSAVDLISQSLGNVGGSNVGSVSRGGPPATTSTASADDDSATATSTSPSPAVTPESTPPTGDPQMP